MCSAFGEPENGQAVQELVLILEPIFRNVVREEVERAINPLLRPSQNQIESSGSRTLQLRFDCELPGTIFTGNRILSEDRVPVKVALYDSGSKNLITSGPLSSLQVDIVVLDGDFSPDDQNNWTEKDFVSKIVPNREGKRPLVTGELSVQLKEGVGCIGEASFTDNSSWIRSGRFRLGLKPNANSTIREGISKAFKVKDHRGESYQKHYPPSLDDEVWRLEKIAKGGPSHKLLAQNDIFSVRDFLRLYITDQPSLRSLLKISNKKWDTIIGHAATCKLDNKFYYINAHGIRLLFNCIYDLVGATFDGQNYLPLNKLDMNQMQIVENLKQHVYKNLMELVPIDDQSAVDYPMLLPSVGAGNFNYPSSSMQNANFPVLQEMQMNLAPPTTSRLYNYEAEQEYIPTKGFNIVPGNSFGMNVSHSESYMGADTWASGGNYAGLYMSINDPSANNFLIEPSAFRGDDFLGSTTQEMGTFSSNPGICVPRNRKHKTRWCKVLAVVKWYLVKRSVAARK
ncbi:calmodulin-binding 60 C [Olea europaea subsp. europaea]|uniref:Calmodulin-binding 60 C n=1 Tax=Olea europaea subsp. europaea TaxID=158383 RepID=A0A8S0TMP7_OLEEU|nr:calmodulin-binding 60 C [Olea europaea subsp. europaea]